MSSPVFLARKNNGSRSCPCTQRLAGICMPAKEKTAETLKSLAVHPRFKTSYVSLSPADSWTSALHPPAVFYIYAQQEKKSSHFSGHYPAAGTVFHIPDPGFHPAAEVPLFPIGVVIIPPQFFRNYFLTFHPRPIRLPATISLDEDIMIGGGGHQAFCGHGWLLYFLSLCESDLRDY